jgi:hypothetical protein
MCKCSIRQLCDEDELDSGVHQTLIDTAQFCPLCGNNKWAFHGKSSNAAGSVVECRQCHNYLKYYFSAADMSDLDYAYLDKEEFYVENYCVLKEDNSMIILNNRNGAICEIPLFSFKDAAHLAKKVKTYITFM